MQNLILNIGTKQGEHYKGNTYLLECDFKATVQHLRAELYALLNPRQSGIEYVEHPEEDYYLLKFEGCSHAKSEAYAIINNYANLLQQGCIALAWVEGDLIGIGATDWGGFNPDYFAFK